jgi:hypothetical protein
MRLLIRDDMDERRETQRRRVRLDAIRLNVGLPPFGVKPEAVKESSGTLARGRVRIAFVKSLSDVGGQFDREAPLTLRPFPKNCPAFLSSSFSAAWPDEPIQIPPLLLSSGSIALTSPPELRSVAQPPFAFRRLSGSG